MRLRFFTLMNTLLMLGLFVFAMVQGQSGSTPQNTAAGDVLAYCLQASTGNPMFFIYTVNDDGTGNARLITSSLGLNHMEYSPGGTRMALVGYMNPSLSTWSIHVYDFDTGSLQRLTNTASVWDSEPAWSPDGSLIAFTRLYPSTMRNETWIMNADGSDLHYIGVQGFQPKWSSDGTRLIYAANVSGNWEIYTCDPSGGGEQKLTDNDSDEFGPSWSPDGQRILFTSTRDGNSEIYVMNTDGSGPVRLTHTASDEYTPKWSPDGLRIAFSSDSLGQGRDQIFIMDANGFEWTQVTNTVYPANAICPTWRPRAGSSVASGKGSTAVRFALAQNYPNPFNPETTVPFEIRERSAVRLDVFDSCGKWVKRLCDEVKSPGMHSVVWNGTDVSGQDVPSGLYFFRFSSGGILQIRKAVLCR